MTRGPATGLVLIGALAACAVEPAPSVDEWTIRGEVRDLPADIERAEGRRGPTGGVLFEPSSVPIDHGVPYRFSLGHCGLASPVDVDGSFWDPIDGVEPGGTRLDLTADSEMINATSGIIAVIDDEARLRTDSGTVVRFARHAGTKDFPSCD